MTEIKIPNKNRKISGSVLELEKQKAKLAQGTMRGMYFEIDEEHAHKLKVKAAEEGITMADIVRQLIKEHI